MVWSAAAATAEKKKSENAHKSNGYALCALLSYAAYTHSGQIKFHSPVDAYNRFSHSLFTLFDFVFFFFFFSFSLFVIRDELE